MLFLSACAAMGPETGPDQGATPVEDPIPEDEEYRINPKDTLDIKIFPDQDLSREVVVSRAGTINFPLLGEIQVQGLSIPALEKKITALLQRDFMKYPQVHIRIKQFHVMSISILGEVNRPGPYELESEQGETTLLEAIARAGGFTQVANIKKIKVIRVEGGEKKVYRVNGEEIITGQKKDIALKANDIIVIEQSWF